MPARSRFGSAREWLVAAGALGLVLGLSWASDRYTCTGFDDDASAAEIARRDAALERFTAERCASLDCEAVDVVAPRGCAAKLQVQAERHDRYGEAVGTFVTTEGLRYSPLLRRWRVSERLDDKQLLGLPVPE